MISTFCCSPVFILLGSRIGLFADECASRGLFDTRIPAAELGGRSSHYTIHNRSQHNFRNPMISFTFGVICRTFSFWFRVPCGCMARGNFVFCLQTFDLFSPNTKSTKQQIMWRWLLRCRCIPEIRGFHLRSAPVGVHFVLVSHCCDHAARANLDLLFANR